MADTGSHGGRWSYREGFGSSYTISSSSGTVSTAYTSGSDSHMSLVEAATHFDAVVSWEVLKGLVQEFFNGANGGIYGAGKIYVLERWFTYLGVGWILRLAAGELEHTPTDAAQLWIRALTQISCIDTYLFVYSFESTTMHQIQVARFIQEAMLRMSSFVEFIIASIPIYGVQGLYEKLEALLLMHSSLSNAVTDFQSQSSVSLEATRRTLDEIVSLLSEKKGKVRESIWTTMEEFWTCIRESMEGDDNSWRGTRTPQGSSGIHKVTKFLTSYIRLLYTHISLVGPIVSEAAKLGTYVIRIANNDPLVSLTTEMALFLEEKLAQKSLLFSDQSLGFLFLVNNSYFIWEELHELCVFDWEESHMEAFPSKIENYIQSYLQVSWAPVLSCLSCTTTFFLGRSSPLYKFEYEFMRTYSTQKLWKVPDPTLRGRLRNAIVERVAPAYRKYLEVNNITTPGITPQEREEMLQELFEG